MQNDFLFDECKEQVDILCILKCNTCDFLKVETNQSELTNFCIKIILINKIVRSEYRKYPPVSLHSSKKNDFAVEFSEIVIH